MAMIGYYNGVLELAALCILIAIMLIYLQQHFIINKAHYAFIWLWIYAFIIPYANIESAIGITNHDELRYLLGTVIYYEAQQLMAYTFMIYSLAPLWRREKLSVGRTIFFLIPLLVATTLIMTNEKTHWIYDCDLNTGTFSQGVLTPVLYITVFFYFGYSIYYAYTRRDVYNEHARYASYNCLFIISLFAYLNIKYPLILSRGFAISLAILQLVIVTMNSHARQDKETGILNRDAFFEWVTNLLYNEIPFDVVLVRAADYEIVVSTYGIESTIKLRDIILKDIKDYIPKNRGYKLSEDTLCIIYEKQNEESRRGIEEKLNTIFNQKRTVDGLDMNFSHFIVTLEAPSKFTKMDELRSYIVYFQKMHRMRYGIMDVEELSIRDLKQEKEVEKAILHALAENQFEMYYQPIINTHNNKFTTAEALIRLNNSIIGFVGPDLFIPIAEKTGLIIEIGDFVIDSVFKFIADNELEKQGLEYIELNLSTIQCLQRDFVGKVEAALRKYNLSPSMICFEITETASNCAPEIFLENLIRLHEIGFKLAIDDFGTGYGNLQRLISMEFDIVKFDKNTTYKIYTDEKVKPLFDKMVTLLHSVDCKVVSEGVETEDQCEYIKKMGVDYVQGYLYSKPVPGAEYLKFLDNN